MASNFLPLLFNNLPPFLRSHHLWTIIWAVHVLFIYPKILTHKLMLMFFAYAIFILIAINTFMSKVDEWNANLLKNEVYQIGIGLSIFLYFKISRNFFIYAKLIKWTLFFILITATMTIVTSLINPTYARDITGISSVESQREASIILSYLRYGPGLYSSAICFMCLFPLLIYFYKSKTIRVLKKPVLILFILILFFALIRMNIFGNVIIAFIISILAFLGSKQYKKSLYILVMISILLLIIPNKVYVNSLNYASDFFKEGTEIRFKLKDMAVFLESGEKIEDSKTSTASRAERYPMLISTFTKSPVLGCFYSGGIDNHGYLGEGAHLYWMNKLTTTGLLGFIFFIILIVYYIKPTLSLVSDKIKYYFLMAILSFIFYGLIKAISGRDAWYCFLIVLPGLTYLPLLRHKKKIKSNKKLSLNNNKNQF
jgi:hypothetical protein